MTQRQYRTKAIVLKRRDLGESDRLLTLITEDHGKVEAVAKGARKPTSRKTGHVELLMCSDLLIARGRSLDIIVQAEMIEPYLPIREDLLRGAYASYVAELLDRFTYGGDDDLKTVFTMMCETLDRLAHDDDVRRVVRYFELHLLDAVGFRPQLQTCVITQEMLLPEDQFFSYEGGGVVSPEGAKHIGHQVDLPLTTLKVLRHMQRSSYTPISKLKLTDAQHADLERIMLGYIRHILENRLQSVDFIRRIRNLPK